MAIFASQTVIKTAQDTFPAVETLVIPESIFIEIQNNGNNAIDYLFVTSTESGRIKAGDKQPFNATTNSIADSIQITFFAPGAVTVHYSEGAAPAPATGGATAANQQIIIDYLNGTTTSVLSGNVEKAELVASTTDGNTDQALSMTIMFDGAGGELDGVTVDDKFIASYSGTMRNEIDPIPYKVPTSGAGRVLIAYTKL